MNICIIKTAALGDVLRTTCILPALRRKWPDSHITWIAASSAVPLLRGNPDVHQAFTLEEAATGEARRRCYDWVISLDDELSCCALATELPARWKSGALVGRGGFPTYTADTEAWFGMGLLRPAALGGLARANELKKLNGRTFGDIMYEVLGLDPPVARPSVRLAHKDNHQVDSWWHTSGLNSSDLVVGLNASAGPRWERKCIPVEHSAALSRALVARFGARILLLGGPEDRTRNRQIMALADSDNVFIAPTVSLRPFFELVRRCGLLVSTDSFAMHAAIAVGTPVVALFGPTSHAEIDFFARGEAVRTPLECASCYLKRCSIQPSCIESITLTSILEACARQLRLGKSCSRGYPGV